MGTLEAGNTVKTGGGVTRDGRTLVATRPGFVNAVPSPGPGGVPRTWVQTPQKRVCAPARACVWVGGWGSGWVCECGCACACAPLLSPAHTHTHPSPLHHPSLSGPSPVTPNGNRHP